MIYHKPSLMMFVFCNMKKGQDHFKFLKKIYNFRPCDKSEVSPDSMPTYRVTEPRSPLGITKRITSSGPDKSLRKDGF